MGPAGTAVRGWLPWAGSGAPPLDLDATAGEEGLIKSERVGWGASYLRGKLRPVDSRSS
jgi:hypothetical protein